MVPTRWPVAVLTLVVLTANAAWAQQRPNQPGDQSQQPPSLPNSIVAGSDLSQQEQQQVRQFVQQGFAQLTAEEDTAVMAGRRQLLQPYRGNPSQSFRGVYGPMLAQRLGQLLGQGGQARSFVRLNAMIVAARVRQPAVLDLAAQAIEDEDAAVRYWAAMTIRNYVQAALQTQEGLPQQQRQALANTLAGIVGNETEASVVKPAIMALATLSAGQANSPLARALNQRLQWHVQNPRRGYQPEQAALRAVYNQLQQTVGNGQVDQNQVRQLARVTFRYWALVSRQNQNQQLDQAATQQRQQLVDLSKQVLGWTANQLNAAGNVPSTPGQWRQKLTQAPYNFNAQDLALPG